MQLEMGSDSSPRLPQPCLCYSKVTTGTYYTGNLVILKLSAGVMGDVAYECRHKHPAQPRLATPRKLGFIGRLGNNPGIVWVY